MNTPDRIHDDHQINFVPHHSTFFIQLYLKFIQWIYVDTIHTSVFKQFKCRVSLHCYRILKCKIARSVLQKWQHSCKERFWITEFKWSLDNGVKMTSASQGRIKFEKKLNINLDTWKPLPSSDLTIIVSSWAEISSNLSLRIFSPLEFVIKDMIEHAM